MAEIILPDPGTREVAASLLLLHTVTGRLRRFECPPAVSRWLQRRGTALGLSIGSALSPSTGGMVTAIGSAGVDG